MKNNIKRYKISFDPSDESITGIELISFVKNPAIKVKGIKLSATELFFKDEEKMIVLGPALIPNLPIYRNDNGHEYEIVFTNEVINNLVEKFNRNLKEFELNDDHSERMAPGFILESWIKEDEVYDKSVKYGFNEVPVGSWFISAKITDKEYWENEVKAKGKYGFSIEGFLDLELSKVVELDIIEGYVASSNVSGYRYNTNNNVLIIEFNDGSRYEYKQVDMNDFEAVVLGDASCITEGENEFGEWYYGKSPSVGAALWKFLIDTKKPYRELKEDIVKNVDSNYSRIYKYITR